MQHDWLNGVVIPDLKHSDKRNRLTIHRMTVTGPYNARSSQSIKIAIDLSIDKSMKIGKSDLTDWYRSSRSIGRNRWHSFRLSIFLDFTDSIDFIWRYICSSVPSHPKMKTDFMQTVNLLTMELQLKVEGSDNLLSLY